MTRKECLDAAAACVLKDRSNEYGEPEDSFDLIADLWTAYTGHVFVGSEVTAMMALLKLARLKRNARHLDSAVDLAGYAACFAECASAEMARPVPFAPKAEGAEYASEKPSGFRIKTHVDKFFKAEPKFKPGDRVQFRDEIPSTSEPHWFDGVYVERLSDGGHAVKFGPHSHVIHCSDKEIRPAPRAEGCEDLVLDEDRMRESMPGIVPQDGPSDMDAPQTPEAVRRHIVDSNPATFKSRTPTGEELAEMAEGEAHA